MEPSKSEFEAPSGLKLYAEVRTRSDAQRAAMSPLSHDVPLRCAALSPRGLAPHCAMRDLRPWRGMPRRAALRLRHGFTTRH